MNTVMALVFTTLTALNGQVTADADIKGYVHSAEECKSELFDILLWAEEAEVVYNVESATKIFIEWTSTNALIVECKG